MNSILIKLVATALAFSQATTRTDAVKNHFDPANDQAEVIRLLRDGCAKIRKVFDSEDIKLDDLIKTASEDPSPNRGIIKAVHGLNPHDLITVYREFCNGEIVANSPAAIQDVINYYNRAAVDLPDLTTPKALRLRGLSVVLDDRGDRFAELYEDNQRRAWIALDHVPDHVQQAFVAAEDKRFFEHRGIDEHGMIRAFIGNLAERGRLKGGSTITQQVAKNLLVGDEVSYERKIREIIVASRLEQMFSKREILEFYLNGIYLGRNSWGIEVAARSYFGKPAKHLTLSEAALLAGLAKGPGFFDPDRHMDRLLGRRAYVLNRMLENGAINGEQMKEALGASLTLSSLARPRRETGPYFIDQLEQEARALAGIDGLASKSYLVHSTIHQELQRATESALQEGLARYESSNGRVNFEGPELNLADAIGRMQADAKIAAGAVPVWLLALRQARLPLYDVHWTAAIVMEPGVGRDGRSKVKVGLVDGRVLPLSARPNVRRKLRPFDVVYVRVSDSKFHARAEIRTRPKVQGAVVVLQNKTGRILAMTGGFSYALSQLNRVTQARRQPGSAIKPLTYLAALQSGLQPNTLVPDSAITLPPITRAAKARKEDFWSPKNYDGTESGISTMRHGFENSKNLVTAHLLEGIAKTPEASLDRVCEIALEARVYPLCERFYPFVLGAQPVRPIDLAVFYATVANEGARPTPYLLESIERNGSEIYRQHSLAPVQLTGADHVAYYQLKSMLQGVLERGTARAASSLAPYVAGKTGTSENENDVWFAGFTNDITIVVWVGYDNADGKRRTLGGGNTGARVALPIFRSIVQAAWSSGVPKTPLEPPSPEARHRLASAPIDLNSGEREQSGSSRAFVEHFRLDERGRIADSRFRLLRNDDGERRRDRRVVARRPALSPDPWPLTGWQRSPMDISGWAAGLAPSRERTRWRADSRRGWRVEQPLGGAIDSIYP